MSEHTKEPLVSFGSVTINQEGYGIVCQKAHSHQLDNPIYAVAFTEEDARRIVACVNACAGIPTDDLELCPSGGLYHLAAHADQLATQHDELLAALEPFANCCEQIEESESDDEWAKFRLLISDYRKAKAAITSVKSGLCGKVNSGHACTMPAGSSCPDCGPACHSVPEGA